MSMEYNKTEWVDNQSIITAKALNNIEEGLFNVCEVMDEVKDLSDKNKDIVDNVTELLDAKADKDHSHNVEDLKGDLDATLIAIKADGSVLAADNVNDAILELNEKIKLTLNEVSSMNDILQSLESKDVVKVLAEGCNRVIKKI